MAIDSAERTRRGGGKSRTVRLFSPDQKAGARIEGSLADSIAQFTADIKDKALRSGVYAGAKLLYDELRLQAPSGPTGDLKAAVYHWHDDKRSVGGKQIYRIGVNKSKAPHWFNVEYGHWRVNVVYRGPGGNLITTRQRLPVPVWVPGHPYLRPTADRMPAAIAAAKARLQQRVGELVKGEA